MIKYRNLDPSLKGMFTNAPRRQRHVIKSDAHNLDFVRSRSEGHVYTSILAAVSEAEAFDEIVVWPGTWVEDDTIEITKDSLRIIAADFAPGHARKNTHIRQYGHEIIPVFSVDGAHNVEIAGFRISPFDITNQGDPSEYSCGIAVAPSAWTHAIYIHDNYFSAYGSIGEHILLGEFEGGAEATDAVVQNNFFQWGGSGNAKAAIIQMYDCPRAEILDNKFDVQGEHGIAIHYWKLATGHKKTSWICNNYFMNADGHAGTTGIDSDVAEPGRLAIIENHFINFSGDSHCVTDLDEDYFGRNYSGDNVISSA